MLLCTVADCGSITHTQSNCALQAAGSISQLQTLRLLRMNISDACLPHIAGLLQLRLLHLQLSRKHAVTPRFAFELVLESDWIFATCVSVFQLLTWPAATFQGAGCLGICTHSCRTAVMPTPRRMLQGHVGTHTAAAHQKDRAERRRGPQVAAPQEGLWPGRRPLSLQRNPE